jgi:hypothetical protein
MSDQIVIATFPPHPLLLKTAWSRKPFLTPTLDRRGSISLNLAGWPTVGLSGILSTSTRMSTYLPAQHNSVKHNTYKSDRRRDTDRRSTF